MKPSSGLAHLRAFLTSRLLAFRWAFAGLAYVLRTQRNAWIHGTATILVVALGLWLGLSSGQWGLIAVALAAVWITEILNTGLEALVDLAAPQSHPLAKIAKDCGAAAVLVAAGLAVLLGSLTLGPPLWHALGLP